MHHSHWRQAHTVQVYSAKGAHVPAKTGEIMPSKLHKRWPHVCRRLETEYRNLSNYYPKFRGHLKYLGGLYLHIYIFQHDKYLSRQTRVCRDKRLDKHTFVVTKDVFVATKFLLVAGPANDTSQLS